MATELHTVHPPAVRRMHLNVGLLVTHPIQYYVPWYRHLASHLNLRVLYVHRQSALGQAASGFGVPFDWDVPLLEGYDYQWLKNAAPQPGLQSFNGCSVPDVEEHLREAEYDAMIIMGWNYRSHLQTLFACRRLGIPVLMRGDSHLLTQRSTWKKAAKYFPYRWLLHQADAHLYVGALNRQYLEHYGVPEKRLFFTPHCVDNAFFEAGSKEALLSGQAHANRCALGISPEAFVFLFVGKLVPGKRVSDFLEGFKRLKRQYPQREMHALVIGDGAAAGALKSSVQDVPGQVHFLGFMNQGELPVWYAVADALVLPSAAETWGLVVNEGMACGLPAVVSDQVGCAHDLIDNLHTGFTYPVGNSDGLSQRMADALLLKGNDASQCAIGEKMETYSLEGATRGLERALHSVCRHHKLSSNPD